MGGVFFIRKDSGRAHTWGVQGRSRRPMWLERVKESKQKCSLKGNKGWDRVT